jgi:polar amino acid transport system substrate-binding protein
MKRTASRIFTFATVITASMALVLAGCGAKESNGAGGASSAAPAGTTAAAASTAPSAPAAKTKIKVATGGSPRPFSYVNDKNELEGYDIEVVKAVFKELPQYEISFEKTEFTSIFAGLDSDRYQIGANNFAMNEARKQKYVYTNAIFKNQYVIAQASSRTDLNVFKDLQGKTTEVNAGVNYTTAIENYNKTHTDNPVKLKYTEADMLATLQNVESGKADFQLIDAAIMQKYVTDYKLKLKAVPLSEEETKLIGAPYSYLILSKGKYTEQLEKDINGALDKLVKDGTVGKISTKYFGGDFSPK